MTAGGIAVDNDIVFKAVCYRLTAVFWPRDEGAATVGVLGAARYVIGSLLAKAKLNGAPEDARADFEAFLASASLLETESEEVALAAEMEFAAQRRGEELDPGESQLAAIAINRSFAWLQTGDKRAIRALEQLLDDVPELAALVGRVSCLEQVVAAAGEMALDRVIEAVCAEPLVDKALTFCFACSSPAAVRQASARDGLTSYIDDVRWAAPRVLAP